MIQSQETYIKNYINYSLIAKPRNLYKKNPKKTDVTFEDVTFKNDEMDIRKKSL